MRQRAFGAGEVDQGVRALQCLQIGRNGHTTGLAGELAGILAQHGAFWTIQRCRQHTIGSRGHGLDQHLSHAAAGACNGNTVWCGVHCGKGG